MNNLEQLHNLTENLDDYELYCEFMNKYRQDILETYSYLKPIINRELDIVLKALHKARRRFNFPLDTVVFPAVKFCKKPIIKWKELQSKDPHVVECIRLRSLCSKLGNLVNVMFILNGFVVIDIDVDYPEPNTYKDYLKIRKLIKDRKDDAYKKLKDIVDVETRRGFQIIRFVGLNNFVYLQYKNVKNSRPLFWTKIHCPESFCTVEVRSGIDLLGTFPEVSHYLDVVNGKLVARKYRALSIIARQFAYSNIIDLMYVKVEELKELLLQVLERLDSHVYSCLKNNIEIGIIDKQRFIELKQQGHITTRPTDTKQINYTIGTLTYEHFRQLLTKIKDKLPNCVRITFFENVPKGYCFAFGRLACTILFKFVKPTTEEVAKVAEEFRNRYASFKRSNLYYWYYYCFSKKPTDECIGYPTCYGIGQEVYEMIKEYANCDKCKYNQQCYYYNLYVLGRECGFKPVDILVELTRGL